MKAPRLLVISFVLLAVVALIAVAVLIVSTVSVQGAEAASAMRLERVPHGREPVSAGSGWAGEIGREPVSAGSAWAGEIGSEPVSAGSAWAGEIGREPVSAGSGWAGEMERPGEATRGTLLLRTESETALRSAPPSQDRRPHDGVQHCRSGVGSPRVPESGIGMGRGHLCLSAV